MIHPHGTASGTFLFGHAARRALGAVLSGLYLALALGSAAPHAGEHLEGPLAWLPAEYHVHLFALDAAPDEAPPAVERCVACQIGRMGPRLPASGPEMVLAPAVPEADRLPRSDRLRGSALRAPSSRAPPPA